MVEKLHEPLLSLRKFFGRLAVSIVAGIILITLAMLIGMIGYHVFEEMPWIDAFVNSAMILSGMGPIGTLKYHSGKLFAGFYALFSGFVFIAIIGVVFAPVIHRFYHKLHIEKRSRSKK